MEAVTEHYLPSEIIEKIVCHFDGRTMLQFKLSSKKCYAIANNACRHNKLWKKICTEEIPKYHFFNLLRKRLNKFISPESISERQYEGIYKHWLQWQNNAFNKILIGEQHFLGLDDIHIIICDRLDVKVIFKKYMCILSLIKNDKKVSTEKNALDSLEPNMQRKIILNSKPMINEHANMHMTYYRNGLTMYTADEIPGENPEEYYTFQLTSEDKNTFATKFWYKKRFNLKANTFNIKIYKTIDKSIDYGLIFGQTNCDDIQMYEVYKGSCCTIDHPWLDRKYSVATALYIYLNILFIGTQNGYLLAYRLHSWDDMVNLKERNLLLEDHLSIGHIIHLDIMDCMDIKAVVVASTSKVFWIKIN